MNQVEFSHIKLFIGELTGIDLDEKKEYLIQTRLAPIAREFGYSNVEALINALKKCPTETLKQKIIDAMTTNETLFFRDVHPFDAFKRIIVPSLIHQKQNKELIIWCAASSSGQEPYTIAIILKELGSLLQGWNIKLIASDISVKMLLKAEEGIYSPLEVSRGLPKCYLLKYFDQEGWNYRIKKELRDMIEFRQCNVIKEWPVSHADVVFMRNILIYFHNETKKHILKRLTQLMEKHSYLILGSSETILGLTQDFISIEMGKMRCYQKK